MNLSDIAIALNVIYVDKITEQFRRDAVLPNLLEVESDSNASCLWDVKLEGRNTAGPRAEGYTVVDGTDMSTDTRKQATLAWAHYEAYGKVSGTAQRVTAANGRMGGGDALIKEELTDALNELTVKISSHSYSGNVGNTPTEIEGLARVVDSSGTYAGLAAATYTSWASPENTLALSSLSMTEIRAKLLRPYKDACGHYPEFILTDGTVFDALLELGDALIQIQTTPITTATGGQVDVVKLGFRYCTVDGVPVIDDRHCTSQTMYALSSRYLSYRQVPPTWTSMDPGQLQGIVKQTIGKDVDINEIVQAIQKGRTRLSAQINMLAKTGDSTRLQAVLDLQLRQKRRNGAAKLTLT